MRAKLKMIKAEMWRRMHQPIPAQGKWLGRVVQGFPNYYAVPTNARALDVFRHHVTDLWRRTLRRRSQKDRLTWARMTQLAEDWLPKPIILHPWPSDRFAVTHPRWGAVCGKAARTVLCGGRTMKRTSLPLPERGGTTRVGPSSGGGVEPDAPRVAALGPCELRGRHGWLISAPPAAAI